MPGEFEDPLLLCEVKLAEMKQLKEISLAEESQLQLERDQVLHAITVAQHQVRVHDDVIVRKRVEKQAYERAELGIASAYDQIVLSTGDIVDIAHNLNPAGGDISDSDEEGNNSQRETVVIR